MIGEIRVASQQQSVGIEEVDQAITQIDGNTAQNKILVDDLTGAVSELSTQTQHLHHAITVFRLQSARAHVTDPANAHALGAAAQHVMAISH